MIRAICILTDKYGKTIGARFSKNGKVYDIDTETLARKRMYKVKIDNAIIDKNGIVRAKVGNLPKRVKENNQAVKKRTNKALKIDNKDIQNSKETAGNIKCINDVKYSDAIEHGIDVSNVGICKKLRALAKLDRIVIDETEHRSGLNKHLFEYIEYCGADILEFVKEYMSNLQPYMIERRKDQEKEKSYICVIDRIYRVSVYIKVKSKQFEEVIVSFHEDNKRGIAKTNSLIESNKKDAVPVIADSIISKVSGENRYCIKVIVQRGLKTLPIEIIAYKSDDIFIVRRSGIESVFIDYCNEYIRGLYTSNLKLDFDRIEVFTVLQQISFTSYGRDTFSSISLLIDSMTIQKDRISKEAADFAIVTFVRNLKLEDYQIKELIELLEQRFSVSSINGIDLIIRRIRDNIALDYRNKIE